MASKAPKKSSVRKTGKRTQNKEEPQPSKKRRKNKTINKCEINSLLISLGSIDLSILKAAVCDKLNEQFSIPDKLKQLTSKLCENEQLLGDIIVNHRDFFVSIYKDCKKGPESFLKFQLCWHQHCSAFLLSSQYSLSSIKLQESSNYALSETRQAWLNFSEVKGAPVPESNPVMITISSVIYNFLLEHVAHFQTDMEASTSSLTITDDSDDVHYRFGGAAICDMLQLHYKQIKTCKDEQRDIISQEISVLQAMNTKDKTKIPGYLQYRDRGYMYFPDANLLPCIKEIDTMVKKIVNLDGLQQKGDDLIKVAHERLEAEKNKYQDTFRAALASKLPNIDTFSEAAIENVLNTFARKICNTRIQEFLSATKQQFATKKGLASTVDVNLRTTLLAHHTKLETKLGSS